MKALRITILVLISIVSLANVNQIIFQAPTWLALGSVAILFLSTATTLGFSNSQNHSLFSSPTLWLIVCLLLQFALITQVPRNQSWVIPYSAVEMILLLTVFGLANKTSKSLQQLDELSESTAVTDIPTLDQAEPIIHNEMTRSRHHERPLAIIAFRLNPTTISTQDSNQSTMQQTQEAQLIQHLHSQMKGYQQIVRDPQNDLYYLICPELNYASAEKFGQQINETITSQTNITIDYASASFPEDGFTFNKIRKEALKRMVTTQPGMRDKTPSTNP